MKKLLLYLPMLFAIVLTVGCKPKAMDNDTAGAATEAQTATPAETPAYPPLGNQEVAALYSQADKVDIIFYHLPISVNQEDPASVKNTTLYVSPASPRITNPCQTIGRLTWMAEGSIVREADVYCEDGCEYLLFIENNNPVYANAMAPAGVAFFRNIISQAAKYQNAK